MRHLVWTLAFWAALRLPAGESPSGAPLLGTRDLRLRFRVAERGAAEIVRHVLHYTVDGGRDWKQETVVPVGPEIHFRAPADGRYGFALSATDAAGAGSPPPAPGDPPALEAVVDTTGPVIRLVRPARPEQIPVDSRVEI